MDFSAFSRVRFTHCPKRDLRWQLTQNPRPGTRKKGSKNKSVTSLRQDWKHLGSVVVPRSKRYIQRSKLNKENVVAAVIHYGSCHHGFPWIQSWFLQWNQNRGPNHIWRLTSFFRIASFCPQEIIFFFFFFSNESFIDTMSAHREIWEVFGACLTPTERGIILSGAYISPWVLLLVQTR